MRNPSSLSRSSSIRPVAAAVLLGAAMIAIETAAPAAHAAPGMAVASLAEFGGGSPPGPVTPPLLPPDRRFRGRASRSSDRLRFRTVVAAAPASVPAGDDVWARLRHCESGGRYDINTGNGFFGAYQFVPRTWRSLGYAGLPHEAPPAVQDEAARRLQARSGWGQWPVCSRRIGAR